MNNVQQNVLADEVKRQAEIRNAKMKEIENVERKLKLMKDEFAQFEADFKKLNEGI